MEVFSLLRYWRGGGSGDGANGANVCSTSGNTCVATTIHQSAVAETDDDDDDDGSFFDLELTLPDDGDAEAGDEHDDLENEDSNCVVDVEDDGDSAGTDGEREFKFTVASGSSGETTDPNLLFSPSDDMFFKGRLVPIEPSTLVVNPSEPNSKTQFPVSLLKSATKLRIFMSGLKKPKSATAEPPETNAAAAEASPAQNQQQQQQPRTEQRQQQQQGKFFTVKFKVEEVPIVSLFTRDSSSKNSGNKLPKQNSDETISDDKRFSKEVLQKYLNIIKPLYVRVSRRYGEKLRFSGQLNLGLGKTSPATGPKTSPMSSPTTTKNNQEEAVESEAPTATVRSQKQGNLPAGLRVVCKRLGKSKSASSAVAAVPPVPSQARRQDDSLLQQQDGIQSAILHCKRSLNATRDTFLLSRRKCDLSKSINSEGSESHDI